MLLRNIDEPTGSQISQSPGFPGLKERAGLKKRLARTYVRGITKFSFL